MPSAVLTVKLTPPACAGELRLTVKTKLVVPASPSACVTSLMESEGVGVGVGEGVGVGVPLHALNAVEVLRGFGVVAVKSVELLSVSVQPPAARMSAVVVEGAGAFAVSEQFAVAP